MPEDPTDTHRPKLDALETAILDGPGRVDPAVRRAAARGEGVEDAFAAYVGSIHHHAYRITDRTLAGLAESGADDDTVFEISVAAAYGAARERLDAGLRALRATAEGA